MNSINILILLLKNQEQKFTINQIAKKLNINYRIAHEQTKKLEREELIRTERVGNALLCSLTGNFNEKIFLAEYQRREDILKNKDLDTIRKRFEKAKQNYILLLFGSYAKGNATKHSDIDLLAIAKDEEEIREIAELIPRKIHLTITNYKIFIEMIKTKEVNVGNEVQKNNIILLGIEEYYRLLKNAK